MSGAMVQPPALINYPLHEHPLELKEPMMVYPEHNGEWQCDNCTRNQQNNMRPYHCQSCQYDMCINCALPVQHPRHPGHVLYLTNMRKIYSNFDGRWKCDGCEVTSGPSLAYHCFDCRFDLCGNCHNGQNFAIHRHPLIPADAARLYNNSAGWWACDSCKREGAGPEINSRHSWHCSQCEFDCCKDCLREVRFPSIHEHPLKLTDPLIPYEAYQGGWKCDRCQREFNERTPEPLRGRPYHCSVCNFDVCHGCINQTTDGDRALDIATDIPPDTPYSRRTAEEGHGRRHEPPTEILDDDDDDEVSENLDDSAKCIVCITRPKKATIVHGSTGHICCCLSCAYTLQRRGDPCPICRAPIDRVIKHFNS